MQTIIFSVLFFFSLFKLGSCGLNRISKRDGIFNPDLLKEMYSGSRCETNYYLKLFPIHRVLFDEYLEYLHDGEENNYHLLVRACNIVDSR